MWSQWEHLWPSHRQDPPECDTLLPFLELFVLGHSHKLHVNFRTKPDMNFHIVCVVTQSSLGGQPQQPELRSVSWAPLDLCRMYRYYLIIRGCHRTWRESLQSTTFFCSSQKILWKDPSGCTEPHLLTTATCSLSHHAFPHLCSWIPLSEVACAIFTLRWWSLIFVTLYRVCRLCNRCSFSMGCR